MMYESAAVRAVTGPAIRPGGLELTRRAADYCRLCPGDRILDVGCGTGATVDFLNHHKDARAVGMDLSPVLLAEARGHDPELPIMRGSALALPVKTAHLAAVTCECVLSLLPAPAAALGEFYRVLQPGGHLVVTDLYWRIAAPGMETTTVNTGGCLRGAVDRETLARWMAAAGFTACLWEDHSDRLKVLAARLVWAGVSLDPWWGNDCRRRTGCGQGSPGYCLMIVRKKEKRPWMTTRST